ncbi:MAG: glycosyltransferase family 4 protein [Parcubacteria group bacterium]|nr:glycosyltransferase family 4 protein [Parcubacteria group bacterium]
MYICLIAHDHTDTLDSTLEERVERMARLTEKLFVCVVRSDESSALNDLPNNTEVVYVDEYRLSLITSRRVKKACAPFVESAKEYVSIVGDDIVKVGGYTRALARAFHAEYNIYVHEEISAGDKSSRNIARILTESRLTVVPSIRVKKTCDTCAGKDLSAIVAIVPPPVLVSHVPDTRPDVYNNRQPVFFLDATHMHEQDVHTALLAFAPVARRYPNAFLTVSGCVRIQKEIKRLIHAESLEQHIICLPTLEQSAVCTYLAYADLALYTPRQAGYGAALIRALLAGAPLLTTDVGVVGSLVTTDDALICPPGDSACLTKRMLLLLDNPAILNSLKESALRMKEKFPRTIFEPERYNLKMKDLLE